MAQADVRRYLDAGEEGEILEGRRRVIARAVPCSPEKPSDDWPDLVERLKRLYPEGPIAGSASDQLYSDRDSID